MADNGRCGSMLGLAAAYRRGATARGGEHRRRDLRSNAPRTEARRGRASCARTRAFAARRAERSAGVRPSCRERGGGAGAGHVPFLVSEDRRSADLYLVPFDPDRAGFFGALRCGHRGDRADAVSGPTGTLARLVRGGDQVPHLELRRRAMCAGGARGAGRGRSCGRCWSGSRARFEAGLAKRPWNNGEDVRRGAVARMLRADPAPSGWRSPASAAHGSSARTSRERCATLPPPAHGSAAAEVARLTERGLRSVGGWPRVRGQASVRDDHFSQGPEPCKS